MNLLRIVFISIAFCVLGSGGLANAAPTKVLLVEGKQEAGQIVVGVMIEQKDPSLRPVLADLRFDYESSGLRFVRAESADARKAVLGTAMGKGRIRLTITGFSLSPLNDGLVARLIFERAGAQRQARIALDEAASKVAPSLTSGKLERGPGLRLVIRRQGDKGS